MMETRISNANQEVIIGGGRPTVLIGERINPTGRKKLAETMRSGDLDAVRRDAVAQVKAGAAVIDVNAGVPGVNEVELFPKVVQVVMEAVDVPLSLDSPNPEALTAALKVYKGKPLINSVTGEESSMQTVLPLAKEYGAAVVALLQGDGGIAPDPEGRVAVARKLIDRADSIGIPIEDLVFDCMAMTLGADHKAATVTLETMRRLRDEYGVNLVLGASNVSFGLPDRDTINNIFIVLTIEAGATCLITNASLVRSSVLATDLVLGRDEYAARYISGYRKRIKEHESNQVA